MGSPEQSLVLWCAQVKAKGCKNEDLRSSVCVCSEDRPVGGSGAGTPTQPLRSSWRPLDRKSGSLVPSHPPGLWGLRLQLWSFVPLAAPSSQPQLSSHLPIRTGHPAPSLSLFAMLAKGQTPGHVREAGFRWAGRSLLPPSLQSSLRAHPAGWPG